MITIIVIIKYIINYKHFFFYLFYFCLKHKHTIQIKIYFFFYVKFLIGKFKNKN